MGVLDLFRGKHAVDMSSTKRDPSNDFWYMDVSGRIGGPVTANVAAKVSGVYACVKVIAETLASLPVDLVSDTDEEHYLRDLLAYQPNPLMTAAEFWEVMAWNAVLMGDAYAEIVPTEDGIELWPFAHRELEIETAQRMMRVWYKQEGGGRREIPLTSLFRFTGLTTNGIEAVVPLSVAGQAIAMARALSTHGARFFENAARPSGILTTPKSLSEQARSRFASQFNAGFAGAVNSGKVPVLEDDFQFKPITATNTDSQYVELRRDQIRELARFWRIPLYMLGEDGGAKANFEQQAIEFVRYTIRPWVRKIEQAIRRDLLTDSEKERLRYKFNLDALLRGDSQTRARNYVLLRTASMASVNELREIEGFKPIPESWADDPREPLNSNRAADTQEGGMTSPQDREDA